MHRIDVYDGESTASSCWFSESLRRDLGHVTLVDVVVVAYNSFHYRSQHRRSKFATTPLIVYLVTVNASDKCKERQAWPMLNLSSASMLSPKASRARQSSSGATSKLQSEQSKLEVYIFLVLSWNVMMMVCFWAFEHVKKWTFLKISLHSQSRIIFDEFK